MNRLCLIGSILALIACSGGGDSTGTPDPKGVGRVEVTLTRAPGDPPLMFSASIQVADRPVFFLIDGEAKTVSDVPEGTQTVDATLQTSPCSLKGQNPQAITVVANQLTRVTLQVECAFDGIPRILFLRREPVWNYDAWTIRPDGTDLQQVSFDAITLNPGWSPDGTKILFYGEGTSPGANDIWVMDADGGNKRVLTQGAGVKQMPAWSHGSQKIAFCSNGRVLTVMDEDGGNPTPLTGEMGCSIPAWALNDQEIIFAGGRLNHAVPQIYRVSPDGSGLTQLTDIVGGFAAPAYSPDGTNIIFNSHSGGERAWIMDVSGENQRLLETIPWNGTSHLRWWGG